MKNSLLRIVKDFLELRSKGKGPLLVACSGGVDSSALLGLLVECRSFFSLDLRCIHFDHGWRRESLEEARLLQNYVQSLSVPFYVRRSNTVWKKGGNWEDRARKERWAFFEEIYQEVGAEALLLAHQREDQAETVLKRVLEGAGLFSLKGMRSASVYESIQVWRPLLSIPRAELESYNRTKNWKPFHDATNFDLRFLRPRMRQQMFPLLEEYFGKSIQKNLCRLSQEIDSLTSDFGGEIDQILSLYPEQPMGAVLPFSDLGKMGRFQKQELIRRFFKRSGVGLSFNSLETLLSLLEEGACDKQVPVSSGTALVAKGDLVWIRKIPDPLCFEIEGEFEEFSVQKSLTPLASPGDSFLSMWMKGRFSYRLPSEGVCHFVFFEQLSLKDQTQASSWLSKNKVPAKMRRIFPFLINNDRLVSFDFCFNFDLKYESDSCFLNIILKI